MPARDDLTWKCKFYCDINFSLKYSGEPEPQRVSERERATKRERKRLFIMHAPVVIKITLAAAAMMTRLIRRSISFTDQDTMPNNSAHFSYRCLQGKNCSTRTSNNTEPRVYAMWANSFNAEFACNIGHHCRHWVLRALNDQLMEMASNSECKSI